MGKYQSTKRSSQFFLGNSTLKTSSSQIVNTLINLIFPVSTSTQRPVIVNILRNLIVQKYWEILYIPVQVELSSTKIVLNKEPAEQQPVVEKERHESEKVTFTRFVWNFSENFSWTLSERVMLIEFVCKFLWAVTSFSDFFSLFIRRFVNCVVDLWRSRIKSKKTGYVVLCKSHIIITTGKYFLSNLAQYSSPTHLVPKRVGEPDQILTSNGNRHCMISQFLSHCKIR